MKSKWLEWKPKPSSVGFLGTVSAVFPITRASEESGTQVTTSSHDGLIEKTVQDEPTKPTESTSVGHGERFPERPSRCCGRHGDTYGWRAHVALDAICGIPTPEGLIVWLREHSPFLYWRLTRDLPNRISRAWNDQVPHENFDALCFDLVDTFRRAADLFRMIERNGQREAREPEKK